MKVLSISVLLFFTAISAGFSQDTIRAGFESSPECYGAQHQFINKTYVPSTLGGVNYLWKFGDGATSTDPFGKHTFKPADSLSNKVYNVTLVVTSKTNPPDVDSVTNQVTVYGLPKVDFTWSVANNGVDQVVTVETLAVDDTNYFYQWNLGGVLKSNKRKPSFSGNDIKPFVDGKNYPFSLFMRSPEGCENQLVKQFNYNPASVKDVKFSINLFSPNPANSDITISVNYNQLEITNLNGQVVQKANGEQVVDLSNLAAGQYFVKILSQGNYYVQRLVKN